MTNQDHLHLSVSRVSASAAIGVLGSTPAGLTQAEAQRRQAEFGANRVEAVRSKSLLRRFLADLTHFFALALWAAAGLAFFAEYQDPGQGMGTLAVAIVAVVLINGAFSSWQTYRAERTLEALERLLPQRVSVLRDGQLADQNFAALVPGDIVVLAAGDLVPADCRLIEAFGVKVNTASLTGESVAVVRDDLACESTDPLHARNLVLAGTVLLSGQARALVYATGTRAEFGRIANLTQSAQERPTPLQQEIARVSRWIVMLAMGLGAVFFLIGQWLGLSFWQNLMFAVGILVANVPEGLLPTVALALAMGAKRLAAKNALVRRLPAVETLGSTSVICTDKTGTLTLNRMEVTAIQSASSGGAVEPAELAVSTSTSRRLVDAMAYCNSLYLSDVAAARQAGGDPFDVALRACAQRLGHGVARASRLDELTFDAQRRMFSTVVSADAGPVLYSKGALEAILPICRFVLTENGLALLDDAERARWIAAEEALAARGLRVLAFADRFVVMPYVRGELERDLVLLGLVGMRDPPRPEVPQAIARCRQAGVRVLMVTGDHPITALAIAREIGLVAPETSARVVVGAQLAQMSEVELGLALDAGALVFARMAPEQKLRLVRALQHKGDVVAVTGDGVNDAPALKQADIGIAMGLNGTDVAREAADMVLLDDNFATIVNAIEEGRAVFQNIRKFLTYILTSNVPELVPYLAFMLLKIPLPLTVVQILVVDLGTDIVPALALGAEKPDPAIMNKPPRQRDERLLSFPMLVRAYLFLGVLEATAALGAFFYVLDGGGWQYGDALAQHAPLYLQATTACFGAIIVMQMVNVFCCRSDTESAFLRRRAPNGLIWVGIGVEIALLAVIVYTPWGNHWFGTAPLGLDVWLFMLPFAAAMLALEETRKAWQRRGERHARGTN